MKTEFTPGPWEAADRGDYSDFDGNSRVILGDDTRIAVVHHHGTPENEANAHLIAAAPDLYRALEAVVELDAYYNIFDGLELVSEDVFAALSKARGET